MQVNLQQVQFSLENSLKNFVLLIYLAWKKQCRW